MDARHMGSTGKSSVKRAAFASKKKLHDTKERNFRKILVLVANRSRLMRELLRSLLIDHADIEVTDAVEPEANLADHVTRCHPDCVIVDFQDGARFCNTLMPKFRDLKILAIPAKKTSSRIYWADSAIHSQKVVTSIEGVLRALRESKWNLQSGVTAGLRKAS